MSDTDPAIDRDQLVQAFGDLGIENVDETVSEQCEVGNIICAFIWTKMNMFTLFRGPPFFHWGANIHIILHKLIFAQLR